MTTATSENETKVRKPGRMARAGIGIAVALVAAGGLTACGSDSEEVSVSDPWVRVTPGTKDMTAAYMVLESKEADRLIAASVPSDIAEKAELHETVGEGHSMDDMGSDSMDDMGSDSMDDMGSDSMDEMGSDSMDEMDDQMEMMGMRQVKSISLPAGKEVRLEPGGYHVMLIGLKNPVEPDDSYMITLTFEKAGKVEVEAVGREG